MVLYIFLYSSAIVYSSNGSDPTNSAYKITPHDHISTEVPSYFLSPTI